MFKRSRIPWSALLMPMTVSTVLVVVFCSVLYLRDADQLESNILDRENRRMEIFTSLFARDINAAVTDLRLLASGDGFQDYLMTGKPGDRDRAVRRAVFFSNENPDYDKIRYLDNRGHEVLRVNHNGVVVPENELQDKADRPFFQKAQNLAPGQIFVSAFDLNMERGAIEQPLKPMVRLSMPVFDATGQRRGVYVINVLGTNIVERLRAFTPQYKNRLRLLNAQGYWLVGAKPDEEWGFMLPGRSGLTLAQTNPELWARVASHPAGQEHDAHGYFTWCRAVPREFAPGRPVTLIADDDFLVFASQITPEEWAAYFARLRQTFVVVALLLMILAMVITWFIQARRRAQQERDRFFNLTRDMLCVAGYDGYFKRVNPAWEKTIGYTSAELLAMPFIELCHPEDRAKVIEQVAAITQGQDIASFESRCQCKDGSYRWFLWSARSLPEEELIYGSARDMTERKQMEESLRLNEEWNRSIIISAHDAFISIDPGGRIKDWNLKAETMFGWSREEVMGRFLHETIIPPQYRESHQRGMKHFNATGEGPVLGKTLELTALRRSGQEFPVELVIWPTKRGQETAFHAFVRDITTRKEADERIQKLNAELKQRAELLEVANEELESFSYSVSHDLRAPLRHIHGFVEMLQKSPALASDETSHRHMGVIARAAKEMGRLIDDLLAFSRTGRAEMNPVRIDMAEMVRQIIQEGGLNADGRRIEWDIQPLPRVQGDPGLLRLVWTNLLDNAVKYTGPRAEAKIEIGHTLRASKEDDGTQESIFFVRDNGVGFDMQYASKLFGVFQRLHRTEEFEGTGIGLANVQRIIHRHGGRVWAEAQLDSGATFFFTLPLSALPNGSKP